MSKKRANYPANVHAILRDVVTNGEDGSLAKVIFSSSVGSNLKYKFNCLSVR